MIHKKKNISRVISSRNGVRIEHYDLPKSVWREIEDNMNYFWGHHNPNSKTRITKDSSMQDIRNAFK